ncbi:MAG: ParB/RepB/Spo0J family partition protein [Chitinispirillaceae bacterium]|nr:ParB/RepB/Spo0J family partition protein [Chitinispirillaceae bacterium]
MSESSLNELSVPVLLPVHAISPSPINEKREGKDKNIESLAADIQSNGLLQPITVRPIADGFEIIFGERRWNAFKFLQKERIPAFVKDVSDKDAHSITFSENFQRENLSPLEEAIALQVLLRDGMTPDEIAVQFGKDIRWVSRRLKLSNLSEKIKNAYLTGKLYAWGPAHLETIARFEIHTQDAFLKDHTVYNREELDYDELNYLSTDDLKKVFDHFLMRLSSVPWDLNDCELYSDAGACSSCTKRTSIQTNLFESLEEKGKVVDRCIDPDCYQIKQKVFTKKKLEKLQEKNPEVVKLTTVYQYGKKDEDIDDLSKGAVYLHHTTDCKKSDSGAKQALITDGPNAGTTKWVKLDKDARVKKEKTEVDVKVKFDTKKKIAVINAMIAFLINEQKTPKRSSDMEVEEILPVIVVFGCDNIESLPDDISGCDDFDHADQWKNVAKYNKRTRWQDALTRMLTLVFTRWIKTLEQSMNKQYHTTPDSGVAFCEGIAKFFSINWEEFVSQAHSTVKIPKKLAQELANAEPDTTPGEKKENHPAKKAAAKKKIAKSKKKKNSESTVNEPNEQEVTIAGEDL